MPEIGTPQVPSLSAGSAQEEDPRELSFEQLTAGIHKFYRRFREAEIAYRQISDTIMGRREAIIPSMPTGQRDENDQMVTVAMDYEALLRFMDVRDPEERKRVLQQMLGPWNNYFVAEYAKAMARLREFVDKAHEQLQRRLQ